VSAVDKATNKQQSIRIESSSGLSKEEIEKMKQEAELNAESDKKAKEDADVLNTADGTIFNVEKSLKDLEDKISEEQKSEITSTLEQLKEAYGKKEIETIKTLTDEVNLKFQKISQDLYSQVSEQMEGMEFDGSDVEFEEVNNK